MDVKGTRPDYAVLGRYLYVTNDTQVVRGPIRADFPGGSPIQY